MFVNIFGKVYSKNPNLVELDLTKKEVSKLKRALKTLIKHKSFTDDEEKYLVLPIINKLSNTSIELLKSELKFLNLLKKDLDVPLPNYRINEKKNKHTI